MKDRVGIHDRVDGVGERVSCIICTILLSPSPVRHDTHAQVDAASAQHERRHAIYGRHLAEATRTIAIAVSKANTDTDKSAPLWRRTCEGGGHGAIVDPGSPGLRQRHEGSFA